ncbi:MAG: Smr/MutS family protein [Bacteroidota bacterium]
MQFKVGDKVRFLDQQGEGIVIGIIDDRTVTVQDESGFDYPYPTQQLVAVHSRAAEHHLYNSKQIEKEDEEKPYVAFTDSAVNFIDIHAHRLISNPEAYSKDYILDIQMNAVKKALSRSKSKKERSLIIIHGEGKGALKSKVRKLLNEFTEIKEVQDASYEKFGKGATEAFFR